MQVDRKQNGRRRIAPLDIGIGLVALFLVMVIFLFTALFAGIFS